jgi:hypothetical protein
MALRSLLCTLCKQPIQLSLDSSWVYLRSAVVQHIVRCPRKPHDATPAEVHEIIDGIVEATRRGLMTDR